MYIFLTLVQKKTKYNKIEYEIYILSKSRQNKIIVSWHLLNHSIMVINKNRKEQWEIIKMHMVVFGIYIYIRFLDKAAIYEENNGGPAEKQSPWRLATVTKVEEMKLILNMIPIWLSTLPFGVTIAQTSTFFIKQASNMDRKIGDGGLILPPTTIFCLAAIGMIVSITIYDKVLVPMLRRTTGNERGINILQRIGIGMLFVIATMIIAALVENKRLQVYPKTFNLEKNIVFVFSFQSFSSFSKV